ncbi:MAG: heme-binding domain-containing protein [Campylobacteraceae bacterium]|nr:heme-binding domain-containing protein [Campylobacteraceae bacterium]
MKYSLGLIVLLLVVIQFIPAKVQNVNRDKNLEIKAPKEVMNILRTSCYDCHSDAVKVPWYASIAPASLFISRHVKLGRQWVNFSIWETYSTKDKDKKLGEIYKSVYQAMPLPSYLKFHKKARLSQKQKDIVREWTGKTPY